MEKSYNWCPGRVCVAYGDPHLYTFYSNTMDMERDIGDYVLYSSTTLRIDVRLRVYISEEGVEWNRVSGIHATGIEVLRGDCDVKLEVYNKFQSQSGELEFLFNEEKVEWDDLADRFDSCDEICANQYDVDKDNHKISIIFADKVVVSIKNVEGMQALYVTVPFEKFATDEILMSEEQLCMETYRKLNCTNDTTMLTNYDYDPELGDFMNCNETADP